MLSSNDFAVLFRHSEVAEWLVDVLDASLGILHSCDDVIDLSIRSTLHLDRCPILTHDTLIVQVKVDLKNVSCASQWRDPSMVAVRFCVIQTSKNCDGFHVGGLAITNDLFHERV
jgi:hypothetical protein